MKSQACFSVIVFCHCSLRFIIALLLYIGSAQLLFAEQSLGPLIGNVTSTSVKIWAKSAQPEKIIFTVYLSDELYTQEIISTERDNSSVYAEFSGLKSGVKYNYHVRSSSLDYKGTFNTHDVIPNKATKIAFGGCYDQSTIDQEKGEIFNSILHYQPDLMLFTGDIPYSKAGELDDLRKGHELIRSNKHFRNLTSKTPVLAVWDDHDFGENNSDGNNPNKTQALRAFREHWPNPKNEDSSVEGMYTKYVINNVEVFLLDTRFYSQQSNDTPTLLGDKQEEWLCNNLKKSKSKYKAIVSGVALSSKNVDGWSGEYFKEDKNKLLNCIYDNKISGAIFISGDLHRTEVHRHKLHNNPFLLNRYIYDFSVSPLNAMSLKIAKNVDKSLYYGNDSIKSMFGLLEFSSNQMDDNTVRFQLVDAAQHELKQIVLEAEDLNLDWRNNKRLELDVFTITYSIFAIISGFIVILVVFKKVVGRTSQRL